MNHYAQIFGSRFERSFIQKIHEDTSPDGKMVQVTSNARSQAGHWIRAVFAASVYNRIPAPYRISGIDPVIIFGDASGGPNGGYGAAMLLPDGELLYGLGLWEAKIKKEMIGKLTFLEALASLSGLLLAPDRLRNKHVQVIANLFSL